MNACAICAHPKIGAIDAGLAIGLTPGVIAGKYHVAKKLVELHAAHRILATPQKQDHVRAKKPVELHDDHLAETPVSSGLADTSVADEATMASCERCEARPSIRFRRAWRDARNENDPQELARMIAWLQEQLQSDDMGL